MRNLIAHLAESITIPARLALRLILTPHHRQLQILAILSGSYARASYN